MTNYQPHNPNQTEHQRERDRWSRRQESSDNSGQADYDLYDQQQEARHAWNQDPDYRDMENPGYAGNDFDSQTYSRQNANRSSSNEEPSYQKKRYAHQGEGFASAKHVHRDTLEQGARPGHSTWGQGSEGLRGQDTYPDYNALNASRGYRGSNIERQWEPPQRGGEDRGRISYADHWPPNGYQTEQRNGANPRWQNNPSYPNDDSRRGAYGLQVDQSNDYSLGQDSSGDRSYNADRYNNPNPYYYADRGFSTDRFSQGSNASSYNQGHRGRGPKGYERSDERVREDICERLALDPHIDASEITVSVKSGVVTLEGSIDERIQKHRAEDIADSCSGVKDVQNRLNVSPRNQRDSASSTQSSPQQTFQQSTQSLTSSLEETGQQRSSETGESKAMAQQKPTRQ